jgi:peptide-methionine (R)-S-oxide reductase
MKFLMKTGTVALITAVVGLAAFAWAARHGEPVSPSSYAPVSAAAKAAASPKTDHMTLTAKVTHTDAEWKKLLTPAEYNITREQGTEVPESSPLTHLHAKGVYRCVDCGLDLFKSDTKFDSGTGWPSFWAPIAKDRIAISKDDSVGMTRDEVHCPRCGAHLGHVFDDGPQPTGLRYCMDGVALQFVADKSQK